VQSVGFEPGRASEERNLYRFETTCGWVNDKRSLIFKWTIPLSAIEPAVKS